MAGYGTGSIWDDNYDTGFADPDARPGVRAAERSLSGRGKLLGVILILVMFQSFFFIVAIEGSPLIPGLSSELTGMEIYLFLMVPALFIIGLSPNLANSKAHVSVISGGSIGRFLTDYAIAGFAAWVLMALILYAAGTHYVPLTGAARLDGLIFGGFFIATTEELLFRVALPLTMNWFVASSFIFALFHLPIDAITYGLGDPTQLLAAFFVRMMAGAVLWAIYRYGSLPMAMAAHFVYDGVLGGYITGGFPVSVAHLGLVPV